MSSPTSNWR